MWKTEFDIPCTYQKDVRSSITAFRECPHACITLSEAGTWGSAEQDWSDAGSTEEPLSENLNDVSGDSEDISFEIDDDWPVQGGTTDPDISPIETQEPAEETVQ